MKIAATVAFCLLAVVTSFAQTAVPRPSAAQAAPQPKFKAIWEPAPFDRDIDLNAVACAGPAVCWAAGDKSTILFTADGGTTWQVQLGGDTESTDDNLVNLFVLDARHAWAMTPRGKILGTSDGATWAELSTVSGTAQGVWFRTPQDGLEFDNPDSTSQSTVRRSTDGGRTWAAASRCGVDASVGGLPRKLQCRLFAADFVSPLIGFAGGSAGIDMRTALAKFGKTSDGGHTWMMSVLPDSERRIVDVKFWTENEGIVVMDRGEELFWTADGGSTWTRSARQRLWPSYYGSGDGQLIVGIGEGGGISYSVNGGRNFTSRPFELPARVRAVTFADAQHGYLVGEHAMVYRYRIVPIDYTSPGMIGAMAP